MKEPENGRFRYYGEVQPAGKAGEMAGRRYVHEFDAAKGKSRGWHETVDHAGNVRQVPPELNNGSKTHHQFDHKGNYTGSWQMEIDLEMVRRVFCDVLDGRMSREAADRWAYQVIQQSEVGSVTYSPVAEQPDRWIRHGLA